MTHDIEPYLLSHLYIFKDQPYNLRNTSILKKSLKYKGARMWNQLPNFIKQAENVKRFKSMWNKWNVSIDFIAQVQLSYSILL